MQTFKWPNLELGLPLFPYILFFLSTFPFHLGPLLFGVHTLEFIFEPLLIHKIHNTHSGSDNYTCVLQIHLQPKWVPLQASLYMTQNLQMLYANNLTRKALIEILVPTRVINSNVKEVARKDSPTSYKISLKPQGTIHLIFEDITNLIGGRTKWGGTRVCQGVNSHFTAACLNWYLVWLEKFIDGFKLNIISWLGEKNPYPNIYSKFLHLSPPPI